MQKRILAVKLPEKVLKLFVLTKISITEELTKCLNMYNADLGRGRGPGRGGGDGEGGWPAGSRG